MMKTTKISYRIGLGLITGAGLAALAVPSFAGSVKNPAPIQFKAANAGSSQMSSISAAPTFSAPRSAVPRGYSTPAPQIMAPAPKAPSFDMSHIDRELYSHQKVGRPYEIDGQKYTPRHDPDYDKTGIASWYGPSFHGKPTASGEIYDMDGMTAAHKTLPLNSLVVVTNVETGQSVTLRINDRGPFIDGRIIDLSRAAAKKIGIVGLGKVRVQYAGPADPMSIQQVQTPQLPVAEAAPEFPEAQPETPMAELAPVKPAPQQIKPAPGYKPLSVVPLGPNTPQNVALPLPEQAPPLRPMAALPKAPVMSAPAIPQPEKLSLPKPQEGKAESGAPQSFTPPQGGGTMTLTILGPIHVAKADASTAAETIPAVYYGEREKPKADVPSVSYVQAATFSSAERAEASRDIFAQAGAVSIETREQGERTLYRVLVGPFSSPDEGAAAQAKVQALGFHDARLLQMN